MRESALRCARTSTAVADWHSPALPPALPVRRFSLSRGVMLARANVPTINIHILLGSRNDLERTARTGHNSSNNRAKLQLREVEMFPNTPHSFRAQVFES